MFHTSCHWWSKNKAKEKVKTARKMTVAFATLVSGVSVIFMRSSLWNERLWCVAAMLLLFMFKFCMSIAHFILSVGELSAGHLNCVHGTIPACPPCHKCICAIFLFISASTSGFWSHLPLVS